MKIYQLKIDDIELHFEELFALKCRSLRKSFQEGQCNNLEVVCREKLLELPKYVNDGKAIVFGAFEDQKMIGFLWAYPRTFFNQPRMFINGIAVEEAYEGMGVAKSLVEEMKVYATNNDYTGIDLTVAPFNEKAVGFYRHIGFEDERIQMFFPVK